MSGKSEKKRKSVTTNNTAASNNTEVTNNSIATNKSAVTNNSAVMNKRLRVLGVVAVGVLIILVIIGAFAWMWCSVKNYRKTLLEMCEHLKNEKDNTIRQFQTEKEEWCVISNNLVEARDALGRNLMAALKKIDEKQAAFDKQIKELQDKVQIAKTRAQKAETELYNAQKQKEQEQKPTNSDSGLNELTELMRLTDQAVEQARANK